MKILIMTSNNYPNGDAAALRQHSLALLSKLADNEVFVAGMGPCTEFKLKIYDGIKYISFRNIKNNIFFKIINLLGYKYRFKVFLKQVQKKGIYFDAIMVQGVPIDVMLYIKHYCIKNNIQLLHDSVEWYSPEQFKSGKFAFQYIKKEFSNKHWVDKRFKVIAISKFLESHFKNRGIKTIRIPAILDIKNTPCNKNTDKNKLTIVYAGSPGKKDYLKEVIEGISLLTPQEISRVELRIIGATKEQILSVSEVTEEMLNKLYENIKIFGRVSREVVLKNLEQADFTVLMRSPIQRYAKAGFPTKVVESLASATPVILNLTSDLGDYISDMENGIIIADCTAYDFGIAIKKALTLTWEQRQEMSKNARKCAEKYFDYRGYVEQMKEILR